MEMEALQVLMENDGVMMQIQIRLKTQESQGGEFGL